MWDAIKVFLDGINPDTQTALIGALATVVTATLGALLVVWQIGRQARNAIRQNQHNEALKLKLHVYEEIVAICRAASHAEVDFSSFVRLFQIDLELCRQMSQIGQPRSIPKARVPVLIEKNTALRDKTIEIISFTERWQIIDPRIEIFRIAINVAIYDIEAANSKYFNTAIKIMPHEMPGHQEQGTLFPWHPPNQDAILEFKILSEELINKLSDLGCYIYDFQVEMQTLLVGELFKHDLPPRNPIDPRNIVIQLNRYEELVAYFDNQTAWGRDKAEIEDKVRADLFKE